jgi:hypothetical protein
MTRTKVQPYIVGFLLGTIFMTLMFQNLKDPRTYQEGYRDGLCDMHDLGAGNPHAAETESWRLECQNRS